MPSFARFRIHKLLTSLAMNFGCNTRQGIISMAKKARLRFARPDPCWPETDFCAVWPFSDPMSEDEENLDLPHESPVTKSVGVFLQRGLVTLHLLCEPLQRVKRVASKASASLTVSSKV